MQFLNIRDSVMHGETETWLFFLDDGLGDATPDRRPAINAHSTH